MQQRQNSSRLRQQSNSVRSAGKLPQRNKKGTGLMVIAGVVVAALVISVVTHLSGKSTESDDVKTGVTYIQTLEATDVSQVENQIKQVKAAERKAALESGEIDVWTLFNDSVIMGDSRAVGFYYYGFLGTDRVLAEAGATILKISEYTPSAQVVNPSSIFLCFGLNDISIGIWPTVEDYIAEYDKQIADLRTAIPGAQVYVVSTIPATDPAFNKASVWRNIPDWNEALKTHFADTDVHFIDISETVAEHQDLYDIDGIHMQKAFYDYWAIAIMAGVTENE